MRAWFLSHSVYILYILCLLAWLIGLLWTLCGPPCIKFAHHWDKWNCWFQEVETLRVKLSESESKVIELLRVSEALEAKLTSSEDDRRALQAQLDSLRPSAKELVSGWFCAENGAVTVKKLGTQTGGTVWGFRAIPAKFSKFKCSIHLQSETIWAFYIDRFVGNVLATWGQRSCAPGPVRRDADLVQ